MVGEFPELQGTMGQYYARHDGEDATVARAIEAHYHPRFANDSLPHDNLGAAVALADKLDTLVGIYGIGLVPTGDRDPFGLRRQALGVLRILSERALPLDLLELLHLTRLSFAAGVLSDSVAADLHPFMLDRLRNYLREGGFAQDEIEAVVSQNPTRIDQVLPKLQAVQAFRAMPEAASLAAANKRIRNILRKSEGAIPGMVDPALLAEPAESELAEAVEAAIDDSNASLHQKDYVSVLARLARLRPQVDAFFDAVMVNAEDPALRGNRLALLKRLGDRLGSVAAIEHLSS